MRSFASLRMTRMAITGSSQPLCLVVTAFYCVGSHHHYSYLDAVILSEAKERGLMALRASAQVLRCAQDDKVLGMAITESSQPLGLQRRDYAFRRPPSLL